MYDGPPEKEAMDPILDRVVRRHVQAHGDINPEVAALLVASEEPCNCGEKTVMGLNGTRVPTPLRVRGSHTFWEGHQDEILKGLRERWTGFDPEFYATKDTFREDAMRCYNLHRRPKGTDCIDWMDSSRKLTPEDWPQAKSVYLCHFCPVATAVSTAKRMLRGMYDREPGESD